MVSRLYLTFSPQMKIMIFQRLSPTSLLDAVLLTWTGLDMVFKCKKYIYIQTYIILPLKKFCFRIALYMYIANCLLHIAIHLKKVHITESGFWCITTFNIWSDVHDFPVKIWQRKDFL